MSDSLRTLLVGLDAASPAVLEPLFEDGVAPALRELFAGGANGPLRSQIPPWTPSAWPSLYTGVNPGKHGVYGFLDFDGYDWDVVDRTDVREQALWNLLDARGLRSVVVNVPVTHPPDRVDGAVVPGYTAPEDPACHPEGILDDVREAVGDYRIYPPPLEGDEPDPDRYRDLVGQRGAAFRYLADRFDPHFGFLQFQQTDTVFHEAPGDDGLVRDVYGAVDAEVAAVLDACDPDAVVVASDHGIGPYGGYEFRVNEFLRGLGFVETRRDGEGMPSWASLQRARRGDDGGADADPRALERAVRLLARVGLTSQRLGAVLERAGLADAVLRYVPQDVVRAGTEEVDFAASTAYVRARIELGVRMNVAGREPDGVVDPDEYEDVRSAIVGALRDVRTPDGEPVFDAVRPREDVYHGDHVDAAPDVVTVPARFDQFLSASLRGEEFGPPSEPWNHKREGVVAMTGAGVDPDAPLEGAHLFDVAPTVLATLGVEASDRMDGTVLPPVDPVGTASYPVYEGPDRAARADDEAVVDHLADLGYLEGS